MFSSALVRLVSSRSFSYCIIALSDSAARLASAAFPSARQNAHHLCGDTGPNPFERAVFRPECMRANAQQQPIHPGSRLLPSTKCVDRISAATLRGTDCERPWPSTEPGPRRLESLQNSFSDDFWPPKFVRTMNESDRILILSEVQWTG